MKVAIVILAVAIVGAFAQDDATTGAPPFKCTSSNSFVCTFQELGHKIKYHASKLGGKLADVGKSVLDATLDQGKSLLANGAQAVLGTVLEHLNKEGLVGKRELPMFNKIKEHLAAGADLKTKAISKLMDQFKDHFHDSFLSFEGKRELPMLNKIKEHLAAGADKLKKLKDGLKAAYEKAVNKLTGLITDNAALKKVEAETDKKVDEAVDEFNKEGKKGFFAMAKTISGKIRDIFKAGMEKLREKYGKKVEERAILGFDSFSDAWEKTKAAISGVAGGIADTFRPHLDNLKSGIAALGAKAKEHAGKLVDAAKGSFNDLKTKLSGHIDTLKGHVGKLGGHALNAVNALKEAVSSIALQAVANAKDTVGDIVSTGTDAAGVVAGHVGDAISGN